MTKFLFLHKTVLAPTLSPYKNHTNSFFWYVSEMQGSNLNCQIKLRCWEFLNSNFKILFKGNNAMHECTLNYLINGHARLNIFRRRSTLPTHTSVRGHSITTWTNFDPILTQFRPSTPSSAKKLSGKMLSLPTCFLVRSQTRSKKERILWITPHNCGYC